MGCRTNSLMNFFFKNFITINNMNQNTNRKLFNLLLTHRVTSTFLCDRTGFTWEFITNLL
jgi:hypothetical protein